MKKLLPSILSFLICFQISANDRKISFNHLDIEDGLSNVSITDIWPDPSGVIWIASTGGLDCYDGNSITRICPPQEIQQGSAEIFAKQIIGSEDGFLYILYSRHLCVLNTETWEIKPFYSAPCNCITYNNGLWIGQKNNLLYAAGPDSQIKTIYTLSPADGDISAILRTTESNIWLGTTTGKTIHLKEDFSLICDNETRSKLHSQIYRIFEDSDKTIWIGTLQDGVVSISKDGRQAIYRHEDANPKSISSNLDFI